MANQSRNRIKTLITFKSGWEINLIKENIDMFFFLGTHGNRKERFIREMEDKRYSFLCTTNLIALLSWNLLWQFNFLIKLQEIDDANFGLLSSGTS